MNDEVKKRQEIVPITSQLIQLKKTTEGQEKQGYPILNGFLIVIGCTIGIVCSQILLEYLRKPPVQVPPPSPPSPFVPRNPDKENAAAKLAGPHLAWAERECNRAIDHNIQIVKGLFEDSKTKTRGYADSALGWYSKWLVIKDLIPFTKESHGPYLKSEFEKQVLSPNKIESTVKECIDLHIKSIRDIESQMLVRIKKDAPNYPDIKGISSFDNATLEAFFEKMVNEASSSASTDMASAVGTMLASEIATVVAVRVGAAIAARMASTGTIAAFSTGSSPYTLGLSIVAGIIIDQIVTWVWDWYADPKGNLSKKLNETLDQMSVGAIDGTEKAPGLRKLLMELNANRAKIQQKATINLLLQ